MASGTLFVPSFPSLSGFPNRYDEKPLHTPICRSWELDIKLPVNSTSLAPHPYPAASLNSLKIFPYQDLFHTVLAVWSCGYWKLCDGSYLSNTPNMPPHEVGLRSYGWDCWHLLRRWRMKLVEVSTVLTCGRRRINNNQPALENNSTRFINDGKGRIIKPCSSIKLNLIPYFIYYHYFNAFMFLIYGILKKIYVYKFF